MGIIDAAQGVATGGVDALRRQQRRLLFGGAAALSLLICTLTSSAVYRLVEENLELSKHAFAESTAAVDRLLVKREQGFSRTRTGVELLLSRRGEQLERQGRLIREASWQDKDKTFWTIQDGQDGIAWKVHLDTSALGEPRYDRLLGLVHDASQSARQSPLETRRPGSLNLIVYDPAGKFLAFTPGAAAAIGHVSVEDVQRRIGDIAPGTTVASSGDSGLRSYLRRDPRTGAPLLVGAVDLKLSADTVEATLLETEVPERLASALNTESANSPSVMDIQGNTLVGRSVQVSPDLIAAVVAARDQPATPQHRWIGDRWVWIRWIQPLQAALVTVEMPLSIYARLWPQLRPLVVGGLTIVVALWGLVWLLHTKVMKVTWGQAEQQVKAGKLGQIAIATSPFPLALIDLQGRLVQGSDSYIRSVNELLSPAELLAELESHGFTGDATAAPAQFEMARINEQGAARRFEVAAAWVSLASETMILVSLYDVTSRHELSVAQEQARAAAEALSRAKTAFVAHVSHEIRTPLHAVMGHLELMAQQPLPPVQAERLESVTCAAQDLSNFLNGVLDLTKAQAGLIAIRPTSTDVVSLVESIGRNMSSVPAAKGLTFDVLIDPQLSGRWEVDPQRLKQVLMNLLGNALKFTDTGFVQLDVALRTSGERSELVITLVDTGPGIEPEMRESVFEPYVQARAEDAGTGLGLPLVREILALAGGAIRLFTPLAGRGLGVEAMLPIVRVPGPTQKLGSCHVSVLCSTDHIASEWHRWLTHWGACANRFDSITGRDESTAGADVDSSWVLVPCEEDWDTNEMLPVDPDHVVVLEISGPAQATYAAPRRLSTMARSGLFSLLSGSEAGHAQARLPGSSGMRFLVVDDHPANRQLLTDQLASLGQRSAMADSGRRALTLFRTEHFDGVMTDLSMPEMSGSELAHELRKEGAACPIILLTAHASVEMHEQAVANGVTEVAVKPLSLQALSQLLSRHWDGGDTPVSGLNAVSFTSEFISTFIRAMREDQVLLRRHLSDADHESVRYVAHRVKGALLLVGDLQGADALQALEEAALAGSATVSNENTIRALRRIELAIEAWSDDEDRSDI